MAAAVSTPSGRAADAHRGVDAGAAHGGRDAGREVAVGDQLDARAGLADLGDEIVMALAVEHDDGQLVDVALEGLGDLAEVLVRPARRGRRARAAVGPTTILSM